MIALQKRDFLKPYLIAVFLGALLLTVINRDEIVISLDVLVFSLLVIASQTIQIPLVSGYGTVTYAVALSMMLLFGPATTSLACIPSTVLATVVLRRKARNFLVDLFNGSQYALCVYIAYTVYILLGGSRISNGIEIIKHEALLILPITVVFFAFNHILIDLVYFFRGDPLTVKDYISIAKTDAAVYGISMPFSIIILLLSDQILFLCLFVLPLALSGQMFKLYEQLKRLNRVHQMLSDIQQEFNLDRIYSTVAATTRELLKCPCVVLWVKTEDGQIVPKVVEQVLIKEFSPGTADLAQDIVRSAVSNGTTELINNIRKDDRFIAVKTPMHFESLLVVPLKIRNKTIGALSCYGLQKTAFSNDHEKLVSLIAAQTAVYIDNAQIYADLQELSIRDSNTGLYNNRYFYQELSNRLIKARLHGTPLSVVVLDIDYFKQINDTYGHLAGDLVLKFVGGVLTETVKDKGIASRYGGEEFTLVLDCSVDEAMQLSETIRSKIADLNISYNHLTIRNITISAGIAAFPEHAAKETDLLEKADTALYWGAKKRGRNKVAVFSPNLLNQAINNPLAE